MSGGSDKCDGIQMDSLITAAGRALAAGDPLGALNRVALRDDAPALALRGIAMARLGDLVRAKALVRSAARAFGPKEAVARARCVVAEAEIALVVDACRHVVREARTVVSLARRPVLFALARALGEAWPGDVPRGTLVCRRQADRLRSGEREDAALD